MTSAAAHELTWNFDMHGVDRDPLLEEALARVDLAEGFVCPDKGSDEATEKGAKMGALRGEYARFVEMPTVYALTDADFLARQLPAAIR
jgi:hypothetical protein